MATKRKPRQTTKSSRQTKKASQISPEVAEDLSEFSFTTPSKKQPVPFFAKLLVLVLIGVAIFWVVRKYRGSIIAAVVNKAPIMRYELNQKLVERYGQTVLDEMVNERLLGQLAKKEGITVTSEDIQKERDALKERLGGEENLQTALQQYGLTEADLNSQITLKLYQQRLAEKLFKVEVSDEEVKTFFDDNKTLYEGKKFDDVKGEIKESLKQQKLQQEFSQWFEEQRKAAQIQTYI